MECPRNGRRLRPFNTSSLPPGDYRIRVEAWDKETFLPKDYVILEPLLSPLEAPGVADTSNSGTVLELSLTRTEKGTELSVHGPSRVDGTLEKAHQFAESVAAILKRNGDGFQEISIKIGIR